MIKIENHVNYNPIFTHHHPIWRKKIQLHEQIKACLLKATNDLHTSLANYYGKWLVLYFYPKDHTPGCTIESKAFAAAYRDFQALNCEVLGISRDSLASHEKFKAKHLLPFALISDQEAILCQEFAVIKTRSIFGKKINGLERSTFILDPKANVKYEWRNVKVAGHVQKVLNTLAKLQTKACIEQ